MGDLQLVFIGWGFLALIFLATTFFIRQNLAIILALNLIFNLIGYVVIAETIGVAKPMEYHIPLYTHKLWDKSGAHLFGYYSNATRTYLLMDEGVPRLYSIPYDEDFLIDLKKAIQAAGGDIRLVKILPDDNSFMSMANTGSRVHVQLYNLKPLPEKDYKPEDTKNYEVN